VAASQIHLVRHGEVFNPDGVLYGRLPGFHLSELGRQMAAAAADELAGRSITALFASPLLRAQESAAPWSKAFDLPVQTDERLIEPTNKFEGGTYEFGASVLLHPKIWPWIMNPFRPSWGEPYATVVARMFAALDSAWESVDTGEVVVVSHQMPIVMVQRAVAGRRSFHDPRQRRCTLSSITTLERRGDSFVEVGYEDLSSDILAKATDQGAV